MENNLNTKKLDEIENVKIHGRTSGNLNPLALFWTGSGFEVNVKASELWMEVETDYDVFEQWISIEINGAVVSRQMLPKGRSEICIFRGMSKDLVKNVRVYKDVQAMPKDEKAMLLINNLKTDGEFFKAHDKKMKIEFIGDSLTSGEGTIGAVEDNDWIPMFFTCLNAYPSKVSKKLNADFRIISQSGWGIVSGWDNDPNNTLPKYYDKVCGVISGERNKKLGAQNENDFSSWQPDFIVINLGSNDSCAFRMPEWKDEKTGRCYKQRMNEDGSFNEDDINKFKTEVIKFLKNVRKHNEKAKIIWAYGMLEASGYSLIQPIYDAILKYRNENEDSSVFMLPLSNTAKEDMGSREHPGQHSHDAAAEKISDFINQLMM